MKENVNLPIIVILFSVILLFNYWVWIKPDSFTRFIRIAKQSKIEQHPSQISKWRLIENPSYIWLPRFIFALAFCVFMVMFYLLLK